MEYTEEEKKAIERCNELKKDCHKEWIGISNQVAIDIVLNLLGRYYVYAHNYRELLKKALDDVRKESKKNADSIPKEVIREKIEEIQNELDEKYSAEKISIFSGNTYMEKFKLLGKLCGLKELLGE